ncbi:hypothetical protein, partial [Lactobacillus helveticus]
NRKKKGLKAQFLPALKCGVSLLNQSQSLSMNLVLIKRKPQNKIYARNRPSVIFFFIFLPQSRHMKLTEKPASNCAGFNNIG